MRFNALFARLGGLWLVLLMALSACTVVVEEGPPPGPLPPPGPAYCSREYEPVCARLGRDRQTFPNACLAREAGYRIVRDGPCGEGGGGGGGGGPQFCTREYAPVCARRRGNVRTFGNACEARAADFRVIYEGPC